MTDFATYLHNKVYTHAETLLDVGLVLQSDLQRQASLVKEVVRTKRQVEVNLLRAELTALQAQQSQRASSVNNSHQTSHSNKSIRCYQSYFHQRRIHACRLS